MAGDEIVPSAISQPSSKGQPSESELIQQIERSRVELGRTVDAIADIVKPANVARRATDKLRQRVATVDPKLVGAGAAVVVGLVVVVIWRRRRR
ncbi:MAG: DUF3618 domain-containing protein [Actinobacteria bacterium]|nr:DUF3618 domain-containing protein [Actinomycetota bacterium]